MAKHIFLFIFLFGSGGYSYGFDIGPVPKNEKCQATLRAAEMSVEGNLTVMFNANFVHESNARLCLPTEYIQRICQSDIKAEVNLVKLVLKKEPSTEISLLGQCRDAKDSSVGVYITTDLNGLESRNRNFETKNEWVIKRPLKH